ncbi:hypothetical protein BO99DRAFT_444984 [Aspergillus violaceofuscus CBS 115571]|uniref:Uncharacterized protein n=1 Tax=Aspergillus violaceofuscus (strain CBS 115571) TaxID=1450538 RepID=A0A2V5HLI9_ASPV1|nr:hypothetical protein BO99DRAFT_444984 [Aspergillus violaceofuscus CBS 115571]
MLSCQKTRRDHLNKELGPFPGVSDTRKLHLNGEASAKESTALDMGEGVGAEKTSNADDDDDDNNNINININKDDNDDDGACLQFRDHH